MSVDEESPSVVVETTPERRSVVRMNLIQRARSVARWWVAQDGIGAADMEALVEAAREYEVVFQLTDDDSSGPRFPRLGSQSSSEP